MTLGAQAAQSSGAPPEKAGGTPPSLKLAMDIAKVFDTTVEQLFAFED